MENENRAGPQLQSATYSASDGYLTLVLAKSQTRVSFAARAYPGLEDATDEQLSAFIVGDEGQSIRWPELNVGASPEALVRRACDLSTPTLERHLSNIGRMRTEAKATAARANGAKGGRPRKAVA